VKAGAVILAAGASTRMGTAKALLDWGGRPLLQHQIDTLVEAGCDPVVVALGHAAEVVRSRIDCRAPCRVIVNAGYTEGRAASVRAGAAALPAGLGAIVITNIDGPCSAATVRKLIEEMGSVGASIVVPRYDDKNGHPAVFAGELLTELRGVDEVGQGLKAVRAQHRETTQFVDVDDPLVGLDLNTPKDYERAQHLLTREA